MSEKEVICPDCLENTVSMKQQTKSGKCNSCMRREIMANASGNPYIKFIDLSNEEKEKILKQREIRRNSAKNIRAKQKDQVSSMSNETKEIVKEEIIGEKQKAGRKQIYTDEMIEQMKLIASDNISVLRLLELMQGLYPEAPLTYGNLNNIIVRHNIPHSSARGRKPKVKEEIDTSNIVADKPQIIKTLTESYNEIASNEVVEYITDVASDRIETNVDTEDIPSPQIIEGEPERFKPIRAEINQVLETKFRQTGCSVAKNYTTADYINMLEMLAYLKENRDTIIRNRRNQQNIMNAYQSDTLHEMENTVLEDGNTYLSDKMHILRKQRRYYECDYKDVNILRTLLEQVDLTTISNALNLLKKNKAYVDAPMFKPLVDTSMVGKYDWAKTLDNSSSKSNISVIHYNPNNFQNGSNNGRPVTRVGLAQNTPPTSQLNSKMRKSLKIFRVSCRISGGGFGVFTPWYRDYECTSSTTALEYAKNTLQRLSSEKGGVTWTNLDVVELNVDNTPVTHPSLKMFKITCELSGGGYGAFSNWEKEYRATSEIQAKQMADKDLKKIKGESGTILISNLQCKKI